MMTIRSNFSQVMTSLTRKLSEISKPDGAVHNKILRQVASDLIANMHERIHVEGKATDGSSFGEYSNAYLKRRAENNLSGKKIILRFEGQLEKLTIVANTAGKISIGWVSDFNGQKAKWMEDRYGKIWSLSESEKEHVKLVADDVIAEYLNAQ